MILLQVCLCHRWRDPSWCCIADSNQIVVHQQGVCSLLEHMIKRKEHSIDLRCWFAFIKLHKANIYQVGCSPSRNPVLMLPSFPLAVSLHATSLVNHAEHNSDVRVVDHWHVLHHTVMENVTTNAFTICCCSAVRFKQNNLRVLFHTPWATVFLHHCVTCRRAVLSPCVQL